MLSKYVDAGLDEIQAIILSFLVKLGPFAVALMPALFTGYAIYHTFVGRVSPGLAMLFAVVVGLAIETVGIVATHTAIDLYNGWQRGLVDNIKLALMVLLVPFYAVAVAGTVWYADSAFEPLVRALGIASPFLTLVVYVAVALARDMRHTASRIDKVEQLEFDEQIADAAHKRRLELRELELKAQTKARELELKAQIAMAVHQSDAQPKERDSSAIARAIPCRNKGCDKTFGSPQAEGAHQRFCEFVAVTTNGRYS